MAFFRRKSTDLILWRSLPWTCAGHGTMPRTECGALLILSCGNSRKILGWSCRRSRGINSRRVLADPALRKNIDDLLRAKRQAAETPAWFQQKHPQAPLTCVAYFSMEFMLSEALPIYSGGLGNVAGDQLKAASDLGVPVVGVGLLYQQGYFRQVIDKDGAQQALYPYNDPAQLPITPLRRRTASGCGWRSPYLVTRSGCARGRSRRVESNSTCWIAMTRRTFPFIEG